MHMCIPHVYGMCIQVEIGTYDFYGEQQAAAEADDHTWMYDRKAAVVVESGAPSSAAEEGTYDFFF